MTECLVALGGNVGDVGGTFAAALDPAIVASQVLDAKSILSLVRQAVRPGDTVMVKGSLGSNMAPVVAALIALEAESGANAFAASEG